MYIVTFIQSDSNNIDSNLCSTPQEVFKLTADFFMLASLEGFTEFQADAQEQMLSKENVTVHVSCYTTIHIQSLSTYSRAQLLLANQQTPLAPQEPKEDFKPFVVAATLPDYSQVVLGRFDTEADQKMFEMNCSIYSYEEVKCGVCGKVLGDESDVFTDHYSPALLCVNHSRFNEDIEAYEATEGDLEKRLRAVKVVLEDSDHFTTSINGTKKAVEEYFAIGSIVNMGPVEDRLVAIKELIFLS